MTNLNITLTGHMKNLYKEYSKFKGRDESKKIWGCE